MKDCPQNFLMRHTSKELPCSTCLSTVLSTEHPEPVYNTPSNNMLWQIFDSNVTNKRIHGKSMLSRIQTCILQNIATNSMPSRRFFSPMNWFLIILIGGTYWSYLTPSFQASVLPPGLPPEVVALYPLMFSLKKNLHYMQFNIL